MTYNREEVLKFVRGEALRDGRFMGLSPDEIRAKVINHETGAVRALDCLERAFKIERDDGTRTHTGPTHVNLTV